MCVCTSLIWSPPHCPAMSEIVLVGILVPCRHFGDPLFGVRWGGGGGGGGGEAFAPWPDRHC